jgi:glucose-1-phosphate thymidylyltransferase
LCEILCVLPTNRVFEQLQGLRIGCLQEIAFENGWTDRGALLASAESQGKSEYGEYLRELATAGDSRP